MLVAPAIGTTLLHAPTSSTGILRFPYATDKEAGEGFFSNLLFNKTLAHTWGFKGVS